MATEETINLYRARVKKGADLLDEKAPGWDGKLCISTLKMSHCDRCVLGQVYGNYVDGAYIALSEVREFNWILYNESYIDSVAEHGFCEFGPIQRYKTLRKCWVELIEARRDAKAKGGAA